MEGVRDLVAENVDFRFANVVGSDLESFVRQKLSAFVSLNDDDWASLWRHMRTDETIGPNRDLYEAGDTTADVGILAKGWAYRYKLLPDGRRQILGVMVPGDSFGVGSALFDSSSHSAMTITTCSVCRFGGESFVDLVLRNPDMGFALLWATMRDNAIDEEHIVRLGRRSALERVGHFFLELRARLQLVSLAGEADYQMPLTQEILSDCLGLSIVHVNRTLRRLQTYGLIRLDSARRWIVIEDAERLAEICSFDPAYLDQRSRPAGSLAEAIRSWRPHLVRPA